MVFFQRYYRLGEAAKSIIKSARDKIFARWMTHLSKNSKITGPIRQEGLQQLLGAIPDIPWDWIEETDSQLRAGGPTESLCLKSIEGAQELENDSELEE